MWGSSLLPEFARLWPFHSSSASRLLENAVVCSLLGICGQILAVSLQTRRNKARPLRQKFLTPHGRQKGAMRVLFVPEKVRYFS